MASALTSSHRWQFFRVGGFDQVKLETGADLVNLDQLDQKLWVALACPVAGIEFDLKTATLIDTDKDGRIRAPELIAAVKWAGAMLKTPDDLVKGGGSLPLAAISDATPEGAQLLASARQILTNLGKKDAAISLEDASDANRIYANTVFNGDGVIILESVADEVTKAVFNDITVCMGVVSDRSGKPGIDQSKADAFFEAAQSYSDWWKRAEGDKNILPLGEATATAAAAVRAIKAKVDDYFGRCRLAAFDPRAASLLNRQQDEYIAIAAKDLTLSVAEVAAFPLAQIAAGKALPLQNGLNPAHADAIAALRADAVKPLLGEKSELAEADWLALQSRLAPFETWSAGKVGAAVEKLGIKRVREILASPAKENITALIAKDQALEPEATAIANVEKLVRFVRDLRLLCVNFVNFKDLYDGGQQAIFQCGALYLDQRSCHLCLPVEDAGRHASMAALAGTYLAYCDCSRQGTGEKRQIVAAFTNGDSDNLMVGRNGVFYDRKGVDWDATITKILDNPISVRQAFWSPYKKLVRLIEEQVAKRAAAADAGADAKMSAAASSATNLDQAKAGPKKVDVGTVAALGVAFGAIGTLVTTLIGYAFGLFALQFWKIVLAFVGLLLVISGPAMIIAWLKLRKRNLGPILDANGWAVNSKAKINVPFGESLTDVAKLPPGAVQNVDDRFGERPSVWPKLVLFVIGVCFLYSLLNQFYLVDKLVYQTTGHHWGRQQPVQQLKEQGQKMPNSAGGVTTNTPASTP
ncbi:MAG TPA: hypothetical protein VMA13_06255 [Candidatus Saccharimonadales bacterium]|nr:hypothetical protein [Candidatus Saccharimonadales bacterium]